MNVQARSADFRRAVTLAGKVVEKHSTIPILESLRCRANGVLEVTGTDLDMTLSASVPRVPGKDTSFALMYPSQVRAALENGGGDDVVFASSDIGKVAITSGALKIKASTLPADDFPIDSERPLDVSFSATFSPEHFRAFDRLACAISTEETRYYLNGIYIHQIAPTTFRAVATTGHVLCFTDLELPDAVGEFPGIIIPRKAVGIFRDLATKATGDVKMTLGTVAPVNREESTAPARATLPRLAAKFDVRGASIAMSTKLIDGTFPDYKRVIPTGNDKPMLFKPAHLRRALRAVSGHSTKIRAVRIALTETGARISAAYIDLGIETSIDLPCEHNSPGFEIGFNGGYLPQIIEAAQGDEVVLNPSDQSGPMLVNNPADTSWTGIIMPMRLP